MENPAKSDEESSHEKHSVEWSKVGFHGPDDQECTGAASDCPHNDRSGQHEHILDQDEYISLRHDLCKSPLVSVYDGHHPTSSYLTLDPDYTKLKLTTYASTECKEERICHIELIDNMFSDVNVLSNGFTMLLWRVQSEGGRPTQLEKALSQHPRKIAGELWKRIYAPSGPAKTTEFEDTSHEPSDDRKI